MARFVLGLEVAVRPALVGLERRTRPVELPPNPTRADLDRAWQYEQAWDIRHAEDLGRMGLLEVAGRVREVCAKLAGDVVLVFNATNVGHPFLRMLDGLSRVPLVVTTESQAVGRGRVAIHEIKASTALSLQEGRLKHAEGMRDAPMVARALVEVADPTASAPAGMALAIGLPAWWARKTANGSPWVSNFPPKPGSPAHLELEEWERNTGRTGNAPDERAQWDRAHGLYDL